MGEPGIDVPLYVRAGPPGEFVPGGFVALAGLGLLQRAELAQRLELIGAGRNPGGFAQLGFPRRGVGGVGGELRLDDVVGVRVVDGVRSRVGEQPLDPLPLRELRRAADVVGQVLVPGSLPGVEPRFLEGRRDGAGVHPLRPAPDDATTDAGGVDRLAGRSYARGERTAGGAPGRGHRRTRIRGADSERTTDRALSAARRNVPKHGSNHRQSWLSWLSWCRRPVEAA
ncbi:hypothetical protein [Streptomyces galilaeus]|uniref:hypothetical protein n=1 Tax=Streptomyces galilaeus TaxID=33899 RepID=UPI0019941FEE|nr:hypothetical protein [Streptomyces galilaeus]GGW76756.1 hypothetical protein GCM10010350_72230 [Streptomyces galilaeus]